ncbi:molybdopterin-dependent oxidoreductase [Rhizobium leguminosarum]|uniref:molybdopterin-dependent oxidoreductase n=1 Tax=Rhizobium leguminosarum TaxID=384 RepID=UPI00391FB740
MIHSIVDIAFPPKLLPTPCAEEVILALEINGRPLTPARGGPVRFGRARLVWANSVKWVGSITAADRRASGAYTTRFYNDPTASGMKPVWGVAPESVIVSPSPRDLLSADMPTKIWGWAWGDRQISSVEVSVDGGGSWRTAAVGPREGRSWQRFELPWTPSSGQNILLCRCTDELGEGQQLTDARNAVHTVQVEVNP